MTMTQALPSPIGSLRAAQYLRMSTEHQRYSPDNQAAAIALYALERGYDIVRTYADEGISGLSLRQRKGLQLLLADVLAGDADFSVILVYDVSRWGRFQNPDQSAHYEFICAEAGVRIAYCNEVFDNDGSMASTLLKNLKRVMAAEYSRDLSIKVTAGRLAVARKGFWLGVGGYGLRRQMIDADGRAGPVLEPGQSKALQAWHNILVPGPAEEVAVVRRVFQLYGHVGMKRGHIAALLNREGVAWRRGRPWTTDSVTRMLGSPEYVGDLVTNLTTSPMGGRARPTDPSVQVRQPRAFRGIVSRSLFEAAQRRLALRGTRRSRQALIGIAQEIYATHGRLTAQLINDTPDTPTASAFTQRFGSLSALYAELGRPAGPAPRRSAMRLEPDEALRRLAELHRVAGYLTSSLINAAPNLPSASYFRDLYGTISAAYALVGFVPLTQSQLLSPVGRARLAAGAARAERLWARSVIAAPSDPEAGGDPIG